MFQQKAIVESWPAGQHFGKTVRFFEVIEPFVVSQWGTQFLVRDQRIGNKRGGPDMGIWFDTEQEAWNHVNAIH